jgi:hypothetical protein
MAPSLAEATVSEEPIAKVFLKRLPAKSRERLEKAGVDLSKGYPWQPENPPRYIDEVIAISNVERYTPFPMIPSVYSSWQWCRDHIDAGLRADPEKKALFGAAKEVIDLTKHIGTEIVGLQLTQLTNQQKDELALLVAERGVVFFRDQELDPKEQLELGQYYGEIEAHPMGPQVPGMPGVTVLWPDYINQQYAQNSHFRKPGGAARWHSDLVHEKHPAGLTHLHNVHSSIFGLMVGYDSQGWRRYALGKWLCSLWKTLSRFQKTHRWKIRSLPLRRFLRTTSC